MCNCNNIGFGTFGQPDNNRTAVKTILGLRQEIDNCILEEIQDLWRKGVITYASCCGHNKINGSIIIDRKSIPNVKCMGYVEKKNDDYYYEIYPKSIPITNKFKSWKQ